MGGRTLVNVLFPCRLHGITSFLQLIRSRYQPISSSALVSLSWNSVHPFHLEQLEEDLIVTFITGKSLIESPSLLRTVFKFKKDQKQELGISLK